MKPIPEPFFHSGTILSLEEGRFIMGMGKRQWAASPNSVLPSFYFPDFFLTSRTPWSILEYTHVFTADELLQAIGPEEISLPAPHWHCNEKALFSQMFDSLQQKIASGELLKAVPFAFERAKEKMTLARLKRAVLNLLQISKKYPLKIYGLWEEGAGILGATPELLFYNHQSTLQTVAMAGTRKQTAETDHDFLHDFKELHEHRLVVKGIEEALIPLTDKIQIDNMQVVHLARLSHLKTPISATLKKGIPFEEIVRVLHPTPALGAFPREKGMQWLREYQQLNPRQRYGAPAGCFFPKEDQSFCYVAIRNVQWDNQEMCIGAGCGVVAASQKEREWREIELKISSTKEMLVL